MPSTDSRWTGQVSVAHLAQLSEATATIRDVVHFVAKRDEVILATRSDNDRCCVFGSTPVVDANETGDTTDGDVGKKIMVDARALADYFKSFETDVCELTVTSRADGTGGTITISDRSLTFNISFSDRRRWEGTFHEPEFQADLEGTATKLVSGLDLLSKIDSGYPEHVLLGVSDQVMCAYAWSELTEMVFGVHPSEVHTCSGPFHSIYPHDVLRESLSIFEADSSIRMRLTPAKNPSNWAVGGQAKFASVDTEYDLTLWLKPQHKPNADKPPALGQKLLSTFRDQDQIAQSDLTWLPC